METMPQKIKPILAATSVLIVFVLGAGVLTRHRVSGVDSPGDMPGVVEDRPDRERPVSSLFDPALAAKLLDDPRRDSWQRPGRIVDELHLRRGEAVADIGAGSGYLMRYMSRVVGPKGC